MTTRLSSRDLTRLRATHAETGSYKGFTPEAPKRRRNLESEMQRALIRWWQLACRDFGVPEILLFSIPNGGNGDAKRGSIMRAEGQRKGAPDLMLACARECIENTGRCGIPFYEKKAFHALFLELKTPTGRLSPEQLCFHAALKEQGYRVEVVRTLEEGMRVVTEYLT